MTSWHVDVDFTSRKPFNSETAFDMIENLAEWSGAVSTSPDNKGGMISIFVDAATVFDATTKASAIVKDAAEKLWGNIEIVGLDVMTEEAFDAASSEPVFPEVVSYAEIAELAGVSRQRARQFTVLRDFPHAVIQTAQGPLMEKQAVVNWISRRSTTRGRPSKKLASA